MVRKPKKKMEIYLKENKKELSEKKKNGWTKDVKKSFSEKKKKYIEENIEEWKIRQKNVCNTKKAKENMKNGKLGKIVVNNGKIAKYVFPNEIPDGFVKGRLKRDLEKIHQDCVDYKNSHKQSIEQHFYLI